VIDEALEGRHLNFNGSTLSGFPVAFKTKFLTVTSVTVTKSKHGFVYLRGQCAAFINLRALECEVGHYFGAEGYFRNSQVAWSSCTSLTALECGVGILFDGTATANRNWCNNVTFISTAMRDCKLGYQTINSANVHYTNFVGG